MVNFTKTFRDDQKFISRVFFIIGFIIFFVFIGVNLIGLSTSPRIDASIIFIFITLMMCGFMVESFRLRDLLSKNKIPF